MQLDARQLDRAAGALLGAAAGDALGVPYELGARPLDPEPEPHGGGLGGCAPSQWSDDTEMSVCIAEVTATGADLRDAAALDAVAAGFRRWYAADPADIGTQTRQVLRDAGPDAAGMASAARALHERTGRTAGNGSLMRTAPVALGNLGDAEAIDEAARLVSALTHHDPEAGEACVLWCLAIDEAVRTGRLDLRAGLPRVSPVWSQRVMDAERHEPSRWSSSNGWVVSALQAAWSAVSRASSYEDGVRRAVLGGGDTDTVAAIAGALLGARYGAGAVPARWRRRLHGWPGLRSRDLTRLALLSARRGQPDPDGWPVADRFPYGQTSPSVVPHPDDPGVLLGAVGALRPGVADAVVSMCRLGATEAPLAGVAPEDHVEVWLVDKESANNDVPLVLRDTASVVRDLRAEGKTVLLHCVHAASRTPVAAAAYGALITGSSGADALRRVQAVLPSGSYPRPSLVRALDEV